MTRAPGWHKWTEDEVKRLFHLRDEEAMPFTEIARDLGIDSGAKCAAKYHTHSVRKRGEARAINGVVPNATTIERDRRNEARLRQDVSSRTFGDPPPGYSALDKRRALT